MSICVTERVGHARGFRHFNRVPFLQSWDGSVRYFLKDDNEDPYTRRYKKQLAAAFATRLHTDDGEIVAEPHPSGPAMAQYSARTTGTAHSITKRFEVQPDDAAQGLQEGVDLRMSQHGAARHDVDLQWQFVERAEMDFGIHGGPTRDTTGLAAARVEMWRAHPVTWRSDVQV